MIERTQFINKLILWKDKQIIKVITGIRRCGKSTLLKMYCEYLLNENIQDNQIIFINFEDLEFEELQDYKKLYSYIKGKLISGKKMYLFLDEIQRVSQYQKVINSLQLNENLDIYITGSNSYVFSGELATNLRGRYIEIPLLPLSFKEYYSICNTEKKESFINYMKTGGFPYLYNLDDSNDLIPTYLEGIYNTVLLKDIEERIQRKNLFSDEKNITDVALLKTISKYLSSTIGSPISLRNITNYIISNNRKVSPNTVSDYVNALCESYLFYPVDAMNISGKEILKSNKKYYIVDLGIRNYILPKTHYDLGFSIENIVYFELLRRGYQVNIGKSQKYEIDFIAKKDDTYTYIQVSASVLDKNTFDREMYPFSIIKDNYEKIILTLDEFGLGNYNGIKVLNVVDWLLNDE